MYKRDKSMWECKECYVTNKEDDTVCVACAQPKDGVAQPAPSKPSMFGASGGPFSFSAYPTVATTTPATTMSFGIPAVTSTVTPFTFGMPTLSTVASTGVTTAVNSSQDVSTSTPVFSFGNLSALKSESGGSLFGNNSFHFGDKSTPPSKSAGNAVVSPPEKKSAADSNNVSIFGGTGNGSFAKSTSE